MKVVFISEDDTEARTLMQGHDMKVAIGEFDNYLRGFKHRELTDDQYNLLEEFKQRWYEDGMPGNFYD